MGVLMGLPLVDGQTNFKGASLAEVREQIYAELAARVGFAVPPVDVVAEVPALPARVDHGRWIVDCPDCNGAEFVWLAGPHVMMCVGCWNACAGHRWRRVELPAADVLAEIDRILQARPLPATRNWYPHESVADLAAENATHADELRPVEG